MNLSSKLKLYSVVYIYSKPNGHMRIVSKQSLGMELKVISLFGTTTRGFGLYRNSEHVLPQSHLESL